MKLTAENVDRIFRDCLWGDDEISGRSQDEIAESSTVVEGVVTKVGFNPQKLNTHRADIEELLSGLPVEFEQGYTFLDGCTTRDGEQWGEQQSAEQLFMLGLGIEKVKLCAPRELWAVLPGGVPYYQVVAHNPPKGCDDDS